MTTKEVLQRAKANLTSEHNVVFNPNNLFETADGRAIEAPELETDGTVCRFCLWGALYVLSEACGGDVSNGDVWRARPVLKAAQSMNGFDDRHDPLPANYHRMIAIYDRAIELA